MNWKRASWLCVDVETTGLDPTEDRIVALACVRKRRNEDKLESLSWLVDPGIPIPPVTTAIHGITDADVCGKPHIGDVADDFLSIVDESDVLIAYHWPFDSGFLFAGIGRDWSSAIARKVIVDPLVVVRFDDVGRFWRGKGRHKLGNAAQQLGIKLPHGFRTHNPSADCWLAISVLRKLLDHLPDDGAEATEMIEIGRAHV